MKITHCSWVVVLLTLAACGPSERQRAQFAEERRADCLDKFCEGDVEPEHDRLKEAALKLNGHWFIGPREYFSTGRNGAMFFWPSRSPGFRGGDFPERGLPVYHHTVEIFLTGRQRWPTPGVERPWESHSWERQLGKLQSQGLRLERASLNPGLDLIRLYHPDGKPYDYIYYVAIDQQRVRGSGPPVLSCLIGTPPNPEDRCTSGEFWQPDVYADFRFNIKHAVDWPAIHDEVVRVLNLSRKAQP